MRRLEHQTLGFQRNAVNPQDSYEFTVGEAVMADGFPGHVTAVLDGAVPGQESYQVTLDAGMGGGEYLARQIYRAPTREAAANDVTPDLDPFEAGEHTSAASWYPELGSILDDRPPIENLKVYASKSSDDRAHDAFDAGHDHGYAEAATGLPPDDGSRFAATWYDREHLDHARDGYLHGYSTYENEDQAGLPHKGGAFTMADTTDDEDEPAPEQPDPVEENDEASEGGDQPDSCGFCGNNEFDELSDTGRGTRAKCAQCGGTMLKPYDGVQWQAESPNAPSGGNPSRQSDGRSVINDPRSVHSSLNVAASAEAGYPIFIHVAGDDLGEPCFEITASWADVRRKAVSIRKEGRVRVLGYNGTGAVGEVDGDTALYETEFNYVPGSQRVAFWHCGCKWGAWANVERFGSFKKFQNRPCSHNLALRYAVRSKSMHGREVTPDTDRLEGQYQRSPVTVQYQRPTERAPGREINRRSVPPGNVRTTWEPNSRVRVKGSWHLGALQFSHQGDTHDMAGSREGETASGTMYAHDGGNPVGRIDYHLTGHSLGDDQGGSVNIEPQMEPGHEHHLPVLMSELEKHLRGVHNLDGEPGWTYDDTYAHGRHFASVAPIHEWARMGAAAGIPPSALLTALCRAGATHEAAREALTYATASWAACSVLVAGEPALLVDLDPNTHTAILHDGREVDASLVKFCTHPFGEELIDEHDIQDPAQGSGVMQTTAEFSSMNGEPAPDDYSGAPHSTSVNPASTGFATSSDPPDWQKQVANPSNLSTWNASLRHVADDGGSDGGADSDGGDASDGDDTGVTHAGVALKAGDTGRVLMIQRSNRDDSDPAKGTWEFPGGKLEDGDTTSLHGGLREWEEEVGQSFPSGSHLTHVHRNKNYVLHTVVTPKESDVDFTNGRATVNPDDPDGDDHEQSAWWEVKHAQNNPALRKEVKKTPWDAIKKSASSVSPVTFSENVRGDVDAPTYDSSTSTTATRKYRTDRDGSSNWTNYCEAPGCRKSISRDNFDTSDWTTELDNDEVHHEFCSDEHALKHMDKHPDLWDQTGDDYDKPTENTIHDVYKRMTSAHTGVLHDEPEPALPSTDAADEDADEPPTDPADTTPPLNANEEGPGVETMRDAPWGFPESNPQPSPQAVDGDQDVDTADGGEGALETAAPSRTVPMMSTGMVDPVLAEFWKTAGGAALRNDATSAQQAEKTGRAGEEISDGDIAATARAVLAKLGAKDFSFAEQRELIEEGMSTSARARNFDEMDLEGTHYALLGDVSDDEALWL